MIFMVLMAAAAATAVACTGETTTRSVYGTSTQPFESIFILNDSAKSWVRYSAGTGGTEVVCTLPACSLNYGPKMVVATRGKLKQALDREAGAYRSVDLEEMRDPVVTITKADCSAVPMPIVKKNARKF